MLKKFVLAVPISLALALAPIILKVPDQARAEPPAPATSHQTGEVWDGQ